jgi:hypothetical protein
MHNYLIQLPLFSSLYGAYREVGRAFQTYNSRGVPKIFPSRLDDVLCIVSLVFLL